MLYLIPIVDPVEALCLPTALAPLAATWYPTDDCPAHREPAPCPGPS